MYNATNVTVTPDDYCTMNYIYKVDVGEPFLSSPNVGLAVGLSIGLFVAAIAVGFCVYYYRKVKRYKQLLNEDEAVRKQQGENPINKGEKRTPRSQGQAYMVNDFSPEKEIQEIQLPEHNEQNNDHANNHSVSQVENIDNIEIVDHNMDDIYKDDE